MTHGIPEEADHLGAVAGQVGGEMGPVNTVCNAVFDGPEHGVIVVRAGHRIYEGTIGDGRFRLTHGVPEEADHLGAVAGHVGGEVVPVNTVCNALSEGPGHGDLVVSAFRHILKDVGGIEGESEGVGAALDVPHAAGVPVVVVIMDDLQLHGSGRLLRIVGAVHDRLFREAQGIADVSLRIDIPVAGVFAPVLLAIVIVKIVFAVFDLFIGIYPAGRVSDDQSLEIAAISKYAVSQPVHTSGQFDGAKAAAVVERLISDDLQALGEADRAYGAVRKSLVGDEFEPCRERELGDVPAEVSPWHLVIVIIDIIVIVIMIHAAGSGNGKAARVRVEAPGEIGAAGAGELIGKGGRSNPGQQRQRQRQDQQEWKQTFQGLVLHGRCAPFRLCVRIDTERYHTTVILYRRYL